MSCSDLETGGIALSLDGAVEGIPRTVALRAVNISLAAAVLVVFVENEDDGDDEDDDDGDQDDHRDQHVLALTGAEADSVTRLGTVTAGLVRGMIIVINLIIDIILDLIIIVIVQHSSGNIHTEDWGVSAISDSYLRLTQHLVLLLLEVSAVKI